MGTYVAVGTGGKPAGARWTGTGGAEGVGVAGAHA